MITEFTVDRKEWLRGSGIASSLLDRAGKKCCLGFLAIACGHSPEDIFGVASPFAVFNQGDRYLMPQVLIGDGTGNEEAIVTCDSWACVKLMDINDDQCIDDDEREERLVKGFQTIGIKVNFIG